MRVLIADDDDEILRMLEIGLKSAGFEVSTAKDAIRAFAHAKKELPDAILLDINMPGGNGLEVLGLLRASPLTRDIPVIIITASADPEMPQKARSLGAADFVAKPFDVKQVQAALARVAPDKP